MNMTVAAVDHTPMARVFREKIGDREFELSEVRLNVFEDVVLWPKNPRLQPFIAEDGNIENEEQLEHHLTQSKGYAGLASSIRDLGQMEPIYVWRKDGTGKYLVLEGATRVAILRDLARRFQNRPEADRFKTVMAKVLPADFSELDRVILLARIHVRGTGVRSWERYTQAKFVWESVTDRPGHRAIMSMLQLADHMGKSVSWASRLRDAYEFSQKYIEYVDTDAAEKEALENFSTLEEISKSVGFGPKVRDYNDPEAEQLRAEVFDMVRNDVFKEYRDARFMQKFFDDGEKWAQLKTHEKHIANKLAMEVNAGSTSLKGRIEHLYGQVERALEKSGDAVGEDDLEELQRTVAFIESQLHQGSAFRFRMKRFAKVLHNASLADVKQVSPDDLTEIETALADIRERLQKYAAT